MDFIWCETCFPPHHHDRNAHKGRIPSISDANRSVKDAWASRGGFPGPAGPTTYAEQWPTPNATGPSTGADASVVPIPTERRSNRPRGGKRPRGKR
jgi:hypothetical protein